jgi:DNA end-binding protein Ku
MEAPATLGSERREASPVESENNNSLGNGMASARRKEAPPKARALNIPGLATRPAWQGHLRLSLVSCAVGLYTATTTTGDISFNLINPATGNRIKMITTDPDTGPVPRSSLVKGYEIEKNNYVLFTEEEIRSVRLETTNTLEIERFVDADTIDRLYWDSPYVLSPLDDGSAQAYAVIQEAMRRTNRIGLGRVVMHGRERLMAIEARDAGLLATSLRMRDEVRNTSEALTRVPHGKPDNQMIAIAEQIIAQKEGPFDPSQFTDRYEDALRELKRRSVGTRLLKWPSRRMWVMSSISWRPCARA